MLCCILYTVTAPIWSSNLILVFLCNIRVGLHNGALQQPLLWLYLCCDFTYTFLLSIEIYQLQVFAVRFQIANPFFHFLSFQIVCILPTNRKDRYDAIKKCCCLEHPVPSQVILGRTLSKKQQLMSVCTKIAMQINCKLGGELWALEIPVSSL